ncbi:MAG: phosphodiester glycosidase family protein [Patescibacteria group bacterium]
MAWMSARVGAALIVLFGLGFAGWSLAVRAPYSPWYVARWEELGEGLERMEFVSATDVNVLLYRIEPEQYDFAVSQKSVPARVKSWAGELPGNHLVINGFYFLEDYSPAGLLISQGESIHAQSFDLDKSGVIELAPQFGIIDTQFESLETDGLEEAGQSYPFLLKHGEESIKEDSRLRARRTFMGQDTAGDVYVGVVWKDDVSLFELMRVLQEVEIDWDDVINLDGGPSTGVSVNSDGFYETLDSAAPVPNVIIIQPK